MLRLLDFKRLWTAFCHSINGLKWTARYETAVLQELVVLAMAIPLSFIVTDIISLRIALIGTVMLVLITELINTAIETLCDHVAPEVHPNIKVVKDAAASSVFIAILLSSLLWLYAMLQFFH